MSSLFTLAAWGGCWLQPMAQRRLRSTSQCKLSFALKQTLRLQPYLCSSIPSVSLWRLSASTWESAGLHTSAELRGWNMLSVHIITSLGPKGSLRWIGSRLPARLRWIYEALYHDEALVERFVSFRSCLSVGIMIVSPSSSLLLFSLAPSSCHLCVFWPLTPAEVWCCWFLAHDKWRRPSLSVRPFEPCVGGSRLSIKCFCWGREKIWYSGETKVICNRKFNCLSPASLSFSLASPPNQFRMKAQVQMRFIFLSLSCSLLPSMSSCTDLMPVFICVHIKALLWLRPTSSHAAESLSATIGGSYLLFLTNLIVLLQEVQVSRGNTPFAPVWRSLTRTQLQLIHVVKVREVQEGALCSSSIKRLHVRSEAPGRKPPLQPAVQRSCFG